MRTTTSFWVRINYSIVRDIEITPDTCRLLQKAYPGSKIIILSVDDNDEAAAKEAGADFVYKDFCPYELIAILKPMFNKTGSLTKED